MSQFGVAPDRVTINAKIDYAIKQGRPSEAIEIFERALEGVSPALRRIQILNYLGPYTSALTRHPHRVQEGFR